MENPQLYNSANIYVFIEYINTYYPEINISEVLEYASITELDNSISTMRMAVPPVFSLVCKPTRGSQRTSPARNGMSFAMPVSLLSRCAGVIRPALRPPV